jgi:predicted nucleic acid-binding protein
VYLETSALLRMLLGEPGGDAITAEVRAADRVVASRLLRIEAERVLLRLLADQSELARLSPGLERDLRELWSRMDMLEISEEICGLAGRVAPSSRLRTLDAIHLATYYQLRRVEPGLRMLTFDERLVREV